MLFKGRNGQVETDKNGITISRKGLWGVILHAFKGEKRIPYASISAIQFRPAGLFTVGYIQFTVLGGVEGRGALFNAAKDENSVLFERGQQDKDFRKLRAMVEEACEEYRNPVVSSPNASIADEIAKLADLRDRGALTDTEFLERKEHLLKNR